MKITKPGYYRTRDGRKAHVTYIRDDGVRYHNGPCLPCIGYLIGRADPISWSIDGHYSVETPARELSVDLVAVWQEPLKKRMWAVLSYGDYIDLHESEREAQDASLSRLITDHGVRIIQVDITEVTDET